MDEKKAAAPRVTTFERSTRRYTSRFVRVYQPSPSANRAAETDEQQPFDPSEYSKKRFGRKKQSVFLFQLPHIDTDRNTEARQLLEIKSVDWLIISERYV